MCTNDLGHTCVNLHCRNHVDLSMLLRRLDEKLFKVGPEMGFWVYRGGICLRDECSQGSGFSLIEGSDYILIGLCCPIAFRTWLHKFLSSIHLLEEKSVDWFHWVRCGIIAIRGSSILTSVFLEHRWLAWSIYWFDLIQHHRTATPRVDKLCFLTRKEGNFGVHISMT